MGKDQEKGSFIGAMVSITQASGKMGKNMVVVIGDLKKVKVIWVSGKMVKWLDMEFILWKLVKNMRDSS